MLASAVIVTVLYAGSLVTPMEGPVAQSLAARGVTFQGEGRGSQEIANLLLAGLRTPDVVILVDPAILARLKRAGLVAQSWSFGSASLGIGWAKSERDAPLFDRIQRGQGRIEELLRDARRQGMRIARTDPRLDPKGAYTIAAMRLLLGFAGERAVLGDDENPAQIFPEQDLLVRIETGEADFGFMYSTEVRGDLAFMPLPGAAAFSQHIRYAIAIMKNAPRPAAARAFVDFILHGEGRAILKDAGIDYLSNP